MRHGLPAATAGWWSSIMATASRPSTRIFPALRSSRARRSAGARFWAIRAPSGRATSPHLHFEVRRQGKSRKPVSIPGEVDAGRARPSRSSVLALTSSDDSRERRLFAKDVPRCNPQRLCRCRHQGSLLPSAATRYSDPATEFPVFRLTDPAHTSVLPPHYARAISRKGGFLLYASDASGSMQAYRMDLKSGQARMLDRCR